MGLKAGQAALNDCGLDASELDLILVSTVTPDSYTPTVSCTIQDKLGASKAMAVDLSAACSGFVYASDVADSYIRSGKAKHVLVVSVERLSSIIDYTDMAVDLSAACSGFVYASDVADSYIRSGKAKHVLVVSVERLSSIIDYTDRTTCVIFGDGAGAAVYTASEDGSGILSTYMRADGSLGHSLFAGALPVESDPLSGERAVDAKYRFLKMGGSEVFRFTSRAVPSLGHSLFAGALPVESDPLSGERAVDAKYRFLKMGGSEVFRFTSRAVPDAIDNALNRAGISAADVDWFVLHQANQRILHMVATRYGLDEEKVYTNIDRFGNTSSASIPLCLAEMKEKNLLQSGQTILMSGFGGGLTYGAIVIKL